jgi:uncharacterized protein with GYD domain
MPHFMLQMKYSGAAVKTMVAHPQDRRKAAVAAVEGVGGKLLGFYYSFGAKDLVVIYEAPDATSALALSLTLGASGSASDVETTPLVTMEEAVAAMKQANKTGSTYKPPTA